MESALHIITRLREAASGALAAWAGTAPIGLPVSRVLFNRRPPRSEADRKAAMFDAATAYSDAEHARVAGWGAVVKADAALTGRSFSSREDMDRLHKHPSVDARLRATNEASGRAKDALAAWLAGRSDDVLGGWLHASPAEFAEKVKETEARWAREQAEIDYADELREVRAALSVIPQTVQPAYAVGDYGMSTVYNMPAIFRVEKVTHNGQRVMARVLAGDKEDELVRLLPGSTGGYMGSPKGYKRLDAPLAREVVRLLRILYPRA